MRGDDNHLFGLCNDEHFCVFGVAEEKIFRFCDTSDRNELHLQCLIMVMLSIIEGKNMPNFYRTFNLTKEANMEQEKYFRSADDTELFYRYRPAKDGRCDKAIVLFHRGHEHSGRMMFIAEELGFDDFAYFAWDARGHGLSPG